MVKQIKENNILLFNCPWRERYSYYFYLAISCFLPRFLYHRKDYWFISTYSYIVFLRLCYTIGHEFTNSFSKAHVHSSVILNTGFSRSGPLSIQKDIYLYNRIKKKNFRIIKSSHLIGSTLDITWKKKFTLLLFFPVYPWIMDLGSYTIIQ